MGFQVVIAQNGVKVRPVCNKQILSKLNTSVLYRMPRDHTALLCSYDANHIFYDARLQQSLLGMYDPCLVTGIPYLTFLSFSPPPTFFHETYEQQHSTQEEIQFFFDKECLSLSSEAGWTPFVHPSGLRSRHEELLCTPYHQGHRHHCRL